MTGDRTARNTTTSNWAYWAIPLIVLGGLLWYLFANLPQREQVAQWPTPPAQSQSVVVKGVDVKNTLGDSLSDLRASLQSITDVESTKAARPKLEAAKTLIDKVSRMAGQLTADQRKTITEVVATAMPTINRLTDKVLEIPGVSDVLRPTIDPVKTKLADLSGQPSTVGSGR